ncbi:hypothetical protein SARC_08553 [Sphaeroforma arctica JP610]|uniref:Uncharacterized protein n=1 Tax=Sphaeroforma arctica JP610 TaxID=667725 RepID=A0A0L0FQQ1_9EUKA|nr:hypothetical protein SARC_08553 [Sphaeroforma arctica JP610]KNC79039.1 hypothetical protein SARC_08553 [Sphaeroforma arctica JP610]|eukprot:XP_014152941.1 hypothetical protein SARC_08553 [Sphaeroforma arctica JP610]
MVQRENSSCAYRLRQGLYSSTYNKSKGLGSEEPPTTNLGASLATEEPPTTNFDAAFAAEKPPTTNLDASLATEEPPTTNLGAPRATEEPSTTNPVAPLATEKPPTTNSGASLATEEPRTTNSGAPLATKKPPTALPDNSNALEGFDGLLCDEELNLGFLENSELPRKKLKEPTDMERETASCVHLITGQSATEDDAVRARLLVGVVRPSQPRYRTMMVLATENE